jgi:hydrogenase large subunit
MPQTVQIGPMTRLEGHLDIETTLGTIDGRQCVTEARCEGLMFRGFEKMLSGRAPLDTPYFTQRICGVCPVPQGLASCLALEAAAGATAANNGRIMRNLVLGANFIHSHIQHFFHLTLLDYVDATGTLDKGPWTPRLASGDMLRGPDAAELLQDYIAALEICRKTDQMGAIFAGRMPHSVSLVPGGCSAQLSAQRVGEFGALLEEITRFIADRYIRDVETLGKRFPDYFKIGRGPGNLLAFGAFDLDSTGEKKLFRRGRFTDGKEAELDPAEIVEYVKYSRYAAADGGGVPPAKGTTEPQLDKPGAYSWIKAPRYGKLPYEVGPLARMWIGGEYRNGISVMDRLTARALETRKIAQAMADWLKELVPGQPTRTQYQTPATASAVGMTEAPRGALGHWIEIANSAVAGYQIITPTSWNASPRDDANVPGPMEQALVGTPVANPEQAAELHRVVHSFDPCLACSVH